MERDTDQVGQLIDLGAATQRTLGAEGKIIDMVGMRDHWGISND